MSDDDERMKTTLDGYLRDPRRCAAALNRLVGQRAVTNLILASIPPAPPLTTRQKIRYRVRRDWLRLRRDVRDRIDPDHLVDRDDW